MGRKAKRARVLARIERLLGSQEETTQQPSVVSNSEMQEKLKEVQKVQEKELKEVEKEEKEVVSVESTPDVVAKPAASKAKRSPKPKASPRAKTSTRKPRGSSKKS